MEAINDISEIFTPFYGKFVNLAIVENRPLLAHYTSLESIEKILNSNEIWFSNPLFMNDVQEIRFGLTEGRNLFFEEFGDAQFVENVGNQRIDAIRLSFLHYYNEFETRFALDSYIFCLSEHDTQDNDGRLSMWRGYGANGAGAALVFNSSFVTLEQGSPLLIAKVNYSSDEDRRNWMRSIIKRVKNIILENEIHDEHLSVMSFHIFNIFKINSILSKHRGFEEEREWRIIYLPERDVNNIFKDSFTYVVGKNGIEPKLKFPVKPLPFERPEAWTFDSIVDRIILGPSLSSFLAVNSFKKMFNVIGKPNFSEKVVGSSIPFRSG